jgi:hypothetical protein
MTWEPETWARQTDTSIPVANKKSGGRTAPRPLNHDATASPRSLWSPFLVPFLAMTNQSHHVRSPPPPLFCAIIIIVNHKPGRATPISQASVRLFHYANRLAFPFPFPFSFPLGARLYFLFPPHPLPLHSPQALAAKLPQRHRFHPALSANLPCPSSIPNQPSRQWPTRSTMAVDGRHIPMISRQDTDSPMAASSRSIINTRLSSSSSSSSSSTISSHHRPKATANILHLSSSPPTDSTLLRIHSRSVFCFLSPSVSVISMAGRRLGFLY